MKEEQILLASVVAGLIARMLCTDVSMEESQALQVWAQELTDNQQLIEELIDPDNLNMQVIDFHRFNKEENLYRIQQRLFGS
jgi:hypothetical protein